MFTGICEEIGTVRTVERKSEKMKLVFEAREVLSETKPGDSILVSGVCLTVTQLYPDAFSADILAASLSKTSLGRLQPGGRVNLERALRADSRLGGHILQGHVHAAVPIREIRKTGDNVYLVMEPGNDILKYCVREGSIAVEGISLTISEISPVHITINIIPETMRRTTLGQKNAGDLVNIETDIIGRYVEGLLFPYRRQNQSMTAENLRDLGF